jgi:ubiquinol-cytochrome c reductase cytochrome c1 subunit
VTRVSALGRTLLSAATVFAIAGFAGSWAVAQTPGPPQTAPAGQAPGTDARPQPASPAPAPRQSQAPAAGTAATAGAQLSEFPIKLPAKVDWSFGGPFGTFDQAQLQRGFQVYKEVCSLCHSMRLVAFRNLGEKGGPDFTAEEVRALAAGYTVTDGPNDAGDMFKRPGRPSDYFPSPFANAEQAAAANGGAEPPDLSVIAKARAPDRGILWAPVEFVTGYQEAGPDYIHALLTGFSNPPPGVTVPPGTFYNPYFLHAVSIKMPPPLSDGQIDYSDGSPETVSQYAADVSAFLMWAAEPRLADRKEIGFRAFMFLIVFAGLMYMTKRKVWSNVAH